MLMAMYRTDESHGCWHGSPCSSVMPAHQHKSGEPASPPESWGFGCLVCTAEVATTHFLGSFASNNSLLHAAAAGDVTQILTPRKLFIMPSKVSVFPSNAISLEEATPRFDDNKGTIHLDVSEVTCSTTAASLSIAVGFLHHSSGCHVLSR